MSDTIAQANDRYRTKLPPAVRATAEAAAELQRKVYSPEAAPADPTPTTTTVVDPPATTSEPTTATPPPAEDWEQKFRSLQGRFDSQVVTANERARTAESAVQRMQNELAELRMQLAAKPAPAPAAAPSPEDEETWGGDLMAAARRQARAEIAPELDVLRRQLQAVEQRTAAASTTIAQQTVEQQLATLVGADWQTTNFDEKFKSWLGEKDPFSGNLRGAMMNAAYSAGDAVRVAAFFNTYRSQHTAAPASTATPQSHTQGAAPLSLEALAAPGAGRSGSNGAAAGQAVITQKDIAQFYSDVNKGRYAGNPVGKAQREAEIFLATKEGRVQT